MPNFDGGHYFFACLLPVKHSPHVSHEERLRAAISVLPTGFPYGDPPPGVSGDQPPSPFAACDRTHFVRLVVIGDTTFNGRDRSDAIAVALGRSPDPMIPNIVDQLSCAYLLVVIDFDSDSGDRADAKAYLANLWRVAGDGLADVFAELVHFRPDMSPEDIAERMLSCQIETTMPFNDYWSTTPPFENTSLWRIAGPGLLALVGVGGAVLLASFALTGSAPVWVWLLAVLLGIAAGVYTAYRRVMAMALEPLPTAPHSNLRSILKALHLQRRFTDFALDAQGKSDADLHAAFGAFVASEKPSQPTPRMRPGTII